MQVQAFFDDRTSTLSYVVRSPGDSAAVLIDSVLDFDPASGSCFTESPEAIAAYLDVEELSLRYVLDTHAHADHLSAMDWFRQRYGAKTVIGSGITTVQRAVRDQFDLGDSFPVDGSQFDVLLDDEDALDVGPFQVLAIHTPGHTPGCISYLIGDALFVGDALFQPDYGTARCDFPDGDAGQLYDSIRLLYEWLPDETRVFTAHDYQPGGREVRFESTIGWQRQANVQLDESTGREEFVSFRKERDAQLDMPTLLRPSLQVNIRAGALPAPESNGLSHLSSPISAFEGRIR